MKHLFLFLSFVFIQVSFGQSHYFGNNPRWLLWTKNVPPPFGVILDEGKSYYYLNGDTILDGHTYHKLFRNSVYETLYPSTVHNYFVYCDSLNPFTYVRDSLNQIYEWWGTDILRYNFNLNIGDSLNSVAPNYYNCGYAIASIDSFIVSNEYRKRFIFTTGPYDTLSLIEGIGWEMGFLEQYNPCPNVSTDAVFKLLCFGTNDTAWYPYVNTSSSCIIPDFTVGIKSQIPNPKVSLSPNPATTQLTITTNSPEKSEIIIYDLLSQKLIEESFTNTTTINTSSLAKGIYLYEVRTAKGEAQKGKVVIE